VNLYSAYRLRKTSTGLCVRLSVSLSLYPPLSLCLPNRSMSGDVDTGDDGCVIAQRLNVGSSRTILQSAAVR